MKKLINPRLLLGLRIYLIAALITIVIITPAALSWPVVLLILSYVFLWWRRLSNNLFLLLEYFIFYAVAVLFSQKLDPLVSPCFALPVLLLFASDLELNPPPSISFEPDRKYRPTKLGLTLVVITLLALGWGILLGNVSLLLSAAIGSLCLVSLIALVILKTPKQPVTAEQLLLRIVAGSKNSYSLVLKTQINAGKGFMLSSPYEWLKIDEPKFGINGNPLMTEIAITPPLSGPSMLRLDGTIIDRWGLIQTNFDFEPFKLNVIPRAQYAEWLARKYLEETKAGTLPLISTVGKIKPLYGLRRGIEYYGSQLYQPGDSIKNIDWKHSIKYNKLITKEFADFHGQEAILLINLVVSNADEADKQAFNILTTALSLAKEQIPSAIAAYNDKESITVTNTLTPDQLITFALKIITKIVTIKNPIKYLGHPDIIRLRSNINRLRSVTTDSTLKLTELMQIEFNNLKNISKTNPATLTLNAAMNKVGKQTSIVVLTQSNHDIEAIEFASYAAFNKGNAVIKV